MSRPVHSPVATIQYALYGDFASWLAETGGALIVTTYNSGKVAVLSAPDGRFALQTWHVPRPMGIAVCDTKLAVAAREAIFVYDVRRTGDREGVQILPASTIDCGRLDVHDMAWGSRGLYFINTRFNCLSRPSPRVNFQRIWQPRFVSQMKSRDSCHLNGLGMRNGLPALVTAFCMRDQPGAWRAEDRFTSGVAIALRTNEVVAHGLNMPHSPRWHADRWWLCNSGDGALVAVDGNGSSAVQEVAALPGFTRGLCFVGQRAVIGRSRIRKKHILDAPPVRARFHELRSGLSLVDSRSGRETGGVDFLRGGREVYDVAFLEAAAHFTAPNLLTDKTPE